MTIFRFEAAFAAGAALLVAAGAAEAVVDRPVAVPSRQALTLLDVITDVPGSGLTYRFRFLAPHIASDAGYDAYSDMQHLCDTYALPRISATGPQPNQIVISLSDKPLEFGEINPDVVQFFEIFSVGDGGCTWETF